MAEMIHPGIIDIRKKSARSPQKCKKRPGASAETAAMRRVSDLLKLATDHLSYAIFDGCQRKSFAPAGNQHHTFFHASYRPLWIEASRCLHSPVNTFSVLGFLKDKCRVKMGRFAVRP